MLAWATLGGFLTRHLTTITHGAISAHDTYVAVTIGTRWRVTVEPSARVE